MGMFCLQTAHLAKIFVKSMCGLDNIAKILEQQGGIFKKWTKSTQGGENADLKIRPDQELRQLGSKIRLSWKQLSSWLWPARTMYSLYTKPTHIYTCMYTHAGNRVSICPCKSLSVCGHVCTHRDTHTSPAHWLMCGLGKLTNEEQFLPYILCTVSPWLPL